MVAKPAQNHDRHREDRFQQDQRIGVDEGGPTAEQAACQPRHHGGYGPDAEFVVRRPVAEYFYCRLVFADRDQHSPEG